MTVAAKFQKFSTTDSRYPQRILAALGESAPGSLYFCGNLELLEKPALAIIGTRRPTAEGLAAARSYARVAAENDWVVISGNAPGIDAAAHEATLESGGSTVVCPPAPPDLYEPNFHVKLPAGTAADSQILVLSPFLPGTPIEKYFFLRRNELVAAQAHVVLVAETGTGGGTLNTVAHSRRFGRQLLVTRMRQGARHYDAHRLLESGGATAVPLTCDDKFFRQIASLVATSPEKIVSPARDLFSRTEGGRVVP